VGGPGRRERVRVGTHLIYCRSYGAAVKKKTNPIKQRRGGERTHRAAGRNSLITKKVVAKRAAVLYSFLERVRRGRPRNAEKAVVGQFKKV